MFKEKRRYVTGDITFKLWFDEQQSNTADQFGVKGEQKTGLSDNYYYWFCEENLEDVIERIEYLEVKLGTDKDKLEKFFSQHKFYNDEEMRIYLGIPKEDNWEYKVRLCIGRYADLQLGIQIRECIKENHKCEFTAEL